MENVSNRNSSTSLYYISLSLGFGNIDDRHRHPNIISISERSSGWATNYSNSSSSNINNSIEKRKKLLEKETLETEELPFLLQSGVLLCRFSLEGDTFFNSCFIFEGSSTSSNLPMALLGPNSPQEHSLPREATSGQHISIYQYIESTQKRSIQTCCRLFLEAAKAYGVPDHLLFKPDDLVQMAHVYKYI